MGLTYSNHARQRMAERGIPRRTAPAPRFARDPTLGDRYLKLSDNKIAYSVELSDLVIADYDETGAVRGIEFVRKQVEPIDAYIEKARKANRGSWRPKVPSGAS
jgi:uncharacterized protein YuzE